MHNHPYLPVPFALAARRAVAKLAGLALAVLALALLLPCAAAWGQGSAPRPAAPARELIAVLDLQAVGATDVEAAALTERLRETLLKTERFKVVDRSQMSAVLNEQALQQTGCTQQECAVQVGRILGVRKIVSGKAVKVSAQQWMLSTLLVDVETAETVRVESVRYRGDLFDMMETQMPGLAQRLAGMDAAPGAATTANAASPAAVASLEASPRGPAATAAAGPLKVAIFPSLLEGLHSQDLRKEDASRAGQIVKVLAETLPPMLLELSAAPAKNATKAHERFLKLPVAAEVQQLTWSGVFVKDPDSAYIYRTGRELGLDLVVLYQARKDKRDVRSFSVYVFDINRLKMTHRDGYWPDGKLSGAMLPALTELLAPLKRPKS